MQSRAIRSSLKSRLAKSHPGLWRQRQGPCCFFSHTLLLPAFVLAAFFLLPYFAAAQPSDGEAYLAQLIEQARHQKLADQREWHLLLHYQARVFGGHESAQDDPGFFLSPEGKTNPAAELEATLAGFFSTDLVGRSKQPAQCAFIARYRWLKEQLGFDATRLPPLSCDRFDRWYEEFQVQSITLIFPSAFMNNPASMFGHTLFRVDQKGQTEQTRILAYTINYAADVPPDAGIAYPVRGIFGGYRGYFSTI
ncbi:MAG: DUF4105 domain-containing protein, partial [Nitrospira sp.]